jgi:glutamate/tyrosine decarboxylase-like PLP-dependent enzyme
MQDEYSAEINELCEPALEVLQAILARNESPPIAPGPLAREHMQRLTGVLGARGVGAKLALDEFREYLVPATTAINSRRYWGLVNCTPWPLAVWADLLVSAANNNAGATHQGPATHFAEQESLTTLRKAFGWSAAMHGLIVAGGSIANFQGALLMRHWAFPLWHITGSPDGLVYARIYVSAASHFSVVRALLMAGFGREQLRWVPQLPGGEMDAAELSRMIAQDLQIGCRPLAIFASAGTTGTGAIDPLQAIAGLAADHHLWLHVDACYGGAALLVPEVAPLLAGIERADSVAIDPHKWLYMPVACGAFFTRHRDLVRTAFAPDDSSYIPADDEHGYLQGLQTSRRSQALALWLVLRSHGTDRIAQAIARDIAHARMLETKLAALGYDVLEGRQLSIVCARAVEPALDAGQIEEVQERLALRIRDRGMLWFATTKVQGRTWLRFNFVNLRTQSEDIDLACAELEAVRHCVVAEIRAESTASR